MSRETAHGCSEHVRKHDVPVTVFLASGIRLQGTVAGFDSYSLVLVRDRHSQLIYKHAISTIVPSDTQSG